MDTDLVFTGIDGVEENKKHKSKLARLFDVANTNTRYWYRGKFTVCIVTWFYETGNELHCVNGIGVAARKSTYANNNGDKENETIRKEVSRGRALSDLIQAAGGVERVSELLKTEPQVQNAREQGTTGPSVVKTG